MLLNFAVQYSIWKVRANQECLELNGTHQFLVYADDVNMLGGSTYTVNKNTEALAVVSKEIVLEVNVEKTKYVIMSRVQHAGPNYILKIGNKSFDRVEYYRYLETNLTIANSIHEEIKSRLNSGNACYHSVQNILSSSLLSKNLKIKTNRTINLLVVLYGCETWSLTLREELRLRIFENMVLRRIFGHKRDEVTGE